MDIFNYKCPCCNAPLIFKSESGQMGCDSCGSSFSLEDFESRENFNDNWDSYTADSGSGDWRKEECDNIKAYSCPSCGAEIITDETTSATTCPYCDNTTVLPKQFEGVYRPDVIIPFKVTKKDAINALKSHYKGKKLLPKLFTNDNKIEEITGTYVPFWLFDCETYGDMIYHGQKITTWSDSDYRYKKTEYYRLSRKGDIAFKHIPVDGSSKIDNILMESIEPFNYDELKEFNTAYLSGYLAEKYDVNASDSSLIANKRIINSTKDAFEKTVSEYRNISETLSDIDIKEGKIQYAFFPIWLLNTKYEGKTYTFVMNGQTGRFIGDLPVCKKRFFGWFASIAASLTLGGFLLALACAAGGII